MNVVKKLMTRLDQSPSLCRKAFNFGLLDVSVPRAMRRLVAGSQSHRYWVRGQMAKNVSLHTRSLASLRAPLRITETDAELLVEFRYANAPSPIVCTKHRSLGKQAGVVSGRKVARVETGDVSVWLHFEDGSSLAISNSRV